MIQKWLGAALLALAPLSAAGLECRAQQFRGAAYSLCVVHPPREDLRLFYRAPDGQPYGQFHRIEAQLAPQGLRLGFAMNAGMYHRDRRPVGLYIEGGARHSPLVTRAGPGNFGMLPNGVFCLKNRRAHVIESRQFAAQSRRCDFASQSGPLLVQGHALHPRLIPGGTSKFIRNGVGTNAAGDVAVFVISDQPVNFHDFASFFKDALGLPDALYFDGNVSRLFAPQLNRNDLGFDLGPVVGVVEPAHDSGDNPGGPEKIAD